MEDFTSKYKGEQFEIALFGGDYQDGVLTAFCSIDDVPHVELNGHILIPLQNIATMHCSSRCDAPEPDWPPRGLEAERNLLKAWLLLIGLCAVFGLAGWAIDGFRLASVFVFCALLVAAAAYWY